MGYVAIASLGVGIIVSGLVLLLGIFALKLFHYRTSLEKRLGVKKNKPESTAPVVKEFHQWTKSIEKRVSKVKFKKISGPQYITLMFGATGLFSFLGIIIFKNIVITVLIAITALLYFDYALISFERRIKESKITPMPTAIKVFLAEYSVTPQIERGLRAVAEQCPSPLNGIFAKAYNGLISGQDEDEVYLKLATDLNFEFGQMFVILLHMAKSNSNVIPLFEDLYEKIINYEELSRDNNQQLQMEKKMSFAMLFAPVFGYLILLNPAPNSYHYLISTIPGRIVIMASFLSAIGWVFLARMTDNVESA